MDLAGRIAEVIRPSMEAAGYALVRVQVLGRQRCRVQVMAERKDEAPMSIDDCAGLSRLLSPLLDVEDPIPGAYTLEISSPGLDRPLVQARDFDRFAGFEARVELGRAMNGRRRFQGRLLGLAGDHVRLDTAAGEVAVPFADILRAKLVLTDELLANRR